MATEDYDEFPGKEPDALQLAERRLAIYERTGNDACKLTEGPLRCTRCGGWYDLWIDPEGPGYVILRHSRPVPGGHELYWHKIDAFSWVNTLGRDIIRFIKGINARVHPLDAPKHRAGVSVRRG